MKRIVVLLMFFLCAGICVSQTSDRKAKRIELTKTYAGVQTKSTGSEQSYYYGYDNKIKEILLKENSIDIVPKRAENQSKQEYLDALNKWIKSNPLLIKPDLRETEIK